MNSKDKFSLGKETPCRGFLNVLIVRSSITNGLAEHMHQNGLTLKRVLLEFDKVRCTAFPIGHSMRLTAPLTKEQRELMELLQVGRQTEGDV